MDNPFGSIFDKFKKGHHLSTESRFIEHIVKHAGLQQNLVKAACRAATGLSQPSLSWFCDHFQSFPFFLGYQQTKHARDSLQQFSKNFLKSDAFASYQNVHEKNPQPDDRETACLFMWPRFGRAVIHKTTFLPQSTGVHISVRLKTGQLFVVQHWRDWLAGLEWRPTAGESELS